MIARQRTGFDAVAHVWRSFVCYDIGRPDDTTIPIEAHPAVIEDSAIGPTERLDGEPLSHYDGPRTWTQGEKVEVIRRHLRAHGPQPAKEIADAIGDKLTSTSTTLKRHGGIFKIIEYKQHGRHRYAVWGLRPEEWKQ